MTLTRVTVYILAIIWFIHIITSVSSIAAAIRLWGNKNDSFWFRLALYFYALGVDGLAYIILVFLARGVKFNWPFTLVIFGATLLKDILRWPLIIYILRGPSKEELDEQAPIKNSGDLPKEFWLEQFTTISDRLGFIDSSLVIIDNKLDLLEKKVA